MDWDAIPVEFTDSHTVTSEVNNFPFGANGLVLMAVIGFSLLIPRSPTTFVFLIDACCLVSIFLGIRVPLITRIFAILQAPMEIGRHEKYVLIGFVLTKLRMTGLSKIQILVGSR